HHSIPVSQKSIVTIVGSDVSTLVTFLGIGFLAFYGIQKIRESRNSKSSAVASEFKKSSIKIVKVCYYL
ncbi:hypothetical protein, partial [uncultured Agitococcus sp.]|uniref:hypothetical protein n=1 Tax=uncultured Agitococcus sp. TaxID=1506599 RepID=UPI002626877B